MTVKRIWQAQTAGEDAVDQRLLSYDVKEIWADDESGQALLNFESEAAAQFFDTLDSTEQSAAHRVGSNAQVMAALFPGEPRLQQQMMQKIQSSRTKGRVLPNPPDRITLWDAEKPRLPFARQLLTQENEALMRDGFEKIEYNRATQQYALHFQSPEALSDFFAHYGQGIESTEAQTVDIDAAELYQLQHAERGAGFGPWLIEKTSHYLKTQFAQAPPHEHSASAPSPSQLSQPRIEIEPDDDDSEASLGANAVYQQVESALHALAAKEENQIKIMPQGGGIRVDCTQLDNKPVDCALEVHPTPEGGAAFEMKSGQPEDFYLLTAQAAIMRVKRHRSPHLQLQLEPSEAAETLLQALTVACEQHEMTHAKVTLNGRSYHYDQEQKALVVKPRSPRPRPPSA